MKSYEWWRKQKRRVQKKYTLFLSWYMSPKELKEWYRDLQKANKEWYKKRQKCMAELEGEKNERD